MEIRALNDIPRPDAAHVDIPRLGTVSPGRTCQPCVACCTWLPIAAGKVGPGEKPAGVPCPLLGRGGCRTYSRRLQLCTDFRCAWLADPSWSAAWRPDRSKLLCLREDLKADLPAALIYELQADVLQTSTAEQIIEELVRTTVLVAIVDARQRRRRLQGNWTVEKAQSAVPRPHSLDKWPNRNTVGQGSP